jgi:hypothetical protein
MRDQARRVSAAGERSREMCRGVITPHLRQTAARSLVGVPFGDRFGPLTNTAMCKKRLVKPRRDWTGR